MNKLVGHAFRRTYEGGKKHAISISVATVLGTTLSTGISMLQQHWEAQAQERQQAKAIEAATAPLRVEIDNLHKENDDLRQANQSQWQAIAKKQDKK